MSLRKFLSASIVSSLILAVSPIAYFLTQAAYSESTNPFNFNGDSWLRVLKTTETNSGETSMDNYVIKHSFKGTDGTPYIVKFSFTGLPEKRMVNNIGNKLVRVASFWKLYKGSNNEEIPVPVSLKSYYIFIESEANINPDGSTAGDSSAWKVTRVLKWLGPDYDGTIIKDGRQCLTYANPLTTPDPEKRTSDPHYTLVDVTDRTTGGRIDYQCYASSLVYGSDIDSLANAYRYHVNGRIQASNPRISDPKLPDSAKNACKNILIPAESDNGWSNLNTIVSLGKNLAAKALDKDGKSLSIKNSDYKNPFTDTTRDKQLYALFYKDNDASYSNKHSTTANVISVQNAIVMGEVDTWTQSDLGTGVAVVNSIENALGFGLIAGGVAGGAAVGVKGGYKLSRSALSWVGARFTQSFGGASKVSQLPKIAQAASGTLSTASSSGTVIVGDTLIHAPTQTAGAAANAAATGGSSAATSSSIWGVGASVTYAAIGALVIAGAVYMVEDWAHGKNQEYYKQLFEGFLAYYYITKHIEYHECITEQIGKGDMTTSIAENTGYTASILNLEKVMAANLLDTLQDADARAGELDTGFQCGTNPFKAEGGPLGWIVCSIFVGAYEFVKSVYNYSFCLLENSIGAETGEEAKNCSACYLDPAQC